MSLNINGERLLAEALADAMERDLANVPEQEQLKKQHRFSKKFVRRMKRIEAEADAPGRAKAGIRSGVQKGGGRTLRLWAEKQDALAQRRQRLYVSQDLRHFWA